MLYMDGYWYIFSVVQQPAVGQRLLIVEASRSHSDTHHSRWDSSGRVIGPTQRPLPDDTQHSQETNIHTPGGIRTQNSSKQAAEDPCLRPRGHWDRQLLNMQSVITYKKYKLIEKLVVSVCRNKICDFHFSFLSLAVLRFIWNNLHLHYLRTLPILLVVDI
jgi:hypothetical protein